MNFYPEGYIVNVTVPFTDLNGTSVTPTAMRAALYDGDDQLIADMGSLAITPADGQREVTILAQLNDLPEGAVRAARVLRVELDTASGTIHKSLTYVIEAEQTVRLLVNSFQGYGAAEVRAMDFVNLTGWAASDETRRRAALVEAYKRLIQLPMVYYPRDEMGAPITTLPYKLDRDIWLTMTPTAFNALPPHFREALRNAQVLEASEILTGDGLARKQRAGIISETIGESSVTLNKAVANFGLSTPALAALSGYIDTTVRITRA